MKNKPKKMKKNSQDEYDNAIATDDPTVVSKEDLQNMTLDAIKKFKSLQ